MKDTQQPMNSIILCIIKIYWKENLLDKGKHEEEDIRADVFAAEFLMPEDYVKEIFYKTVNVDKNKVRTKHIIRMHKFFLK